MNINEKIIEDVRKDIQSRNKVIESIYTNEELKSSIAAYIGKNGGEANEANDVFTFAIMTFIKQCYRPQFQVSKDINAYIFSIAKYEWIRMSKKKMRVVGEENRKELKDDLNIESLIIDEETRGSLGSALKKLDAKCRDVLTMWANSLKMREIAIQMEYKSEGMARKKKHECIKKLRNLFKVN